MQKSKFGPRSKSFEHPGSNVLSSDLPVVLRLEPYLLYHLNAGFT